ncbi:MAG TPA: LysR family transcriptional regulator [Solirubrobacteraceae bacterium]|jgi:DNA-binding transcriptional LysR family regulator|nr:LysR family transcriptional regulator [Solirubrobacteraceae bacterium]
MELRQLEHFVAVAEDESFTRAARRLGYVQSALSVSIQSLERELSLRLFERTTHRVRLTEAGRALLPSARATIAAAGGFRDEAAAVNGVLRGRLRIGLMQSFNVLNVPRLLGRFHREHPDVELTVRPAVGGSATLLSAVATGELDLAFIAVAEPPTGLRMLPLIQEPLQLVASEGEALPLQRSVKLEQLAETSFVDFPIGWGIRTVVDQAFAQLGLQRRIGIEVADVTTFLQLVREGLGVALLPDSLMTADPHGLRTHPITPTLSWDVAVVAREPEATSPAAEAFLALV